MLNWQFYGPFDLEYWINDLVKQQGTSSMLIQALCIVLLSYVNSNWSYSPDTLNSGQNW